MNHMMTGCVIEAGAQLTPNIQKIPNGKPFFARQHSGNAVALHVLHGGAKLAFDFTRAKYIGDVRTAQNLSALSLCQQRVFKRRRALSERAQLNALQGNRLPALGVVSFVDHTRRRLRQFTLNFERANFRRHLYCFPLYCFPRATASRAFASPRPNSAGRGPGGMAGLG
jgi:hypothetical protein